MTHPTPDPATCRHSGAKLDEQKIGVSAEDSAKGCDECIYIKTITDRIEFVVGGFRKDSDFGDVADIVKKYGDARAKEAAAEAMREVERVRSLIQQALMVINMHILAAKEPT